MPAMKLSRPVSAALELLLGLCMLQCTSAKRVAETHLAPTPDLPDEYSQAVAVALRNAEKDELKTQFKVSGEVLIPGGRLKGFSRLRVLPDGGMLILDAIGKHAGVYDRSGNYLNPIGARGNRPGYYSTPSDVAPAEDGTIAVSDFQLHRVNVYTAHGDFRRSFIYTPQ